MLLSRNNLDGTMKTKVLNKVKKETEFQEFYTKISKYIPDLENFTRSKLKIAENEGVIPIGFYKAEGLLDEVYLDLYLSDFKKLEDIALKKELFLKSIEIFDKINTIENQITKKIPTHIILKEELDLLEGNYSVDAGGDFIPEEEFDDISYHQKDFRPTHFIMNEAPEKQIADRLFLKENNLFPTMKKKEIAQLIRTLPAKSSTILDLYVFGNQKINEIANILNLEIKQVESVISRITKKLEK